MPTSQIKYKIVTKRALKSDTFKSFMEYIFDHFPEKEEKSMANSFISELSRKYNKIHHGFTCIDYDNAMCCWTSAMAEKRNITLDQYNNIYLIRDKHVREYSVIILV